MDCLVRFSLAAGLFMALAGPVSAQDASAEAEGAMEMPPAYDCTFNAATLCKAGAECAPADKIGDLPLPARVLVNFEQRVIAGVNADGLPHVSSITDLAQSGDILVALGVDGGTGWMIHSTANDDEVTFVAASDDFVVNAFGACKPTE